MILQPTKSHFFPKASLLNLQIFDFSQILNIFYMIQEQIETSHQSHQPNKKDPIGLQLMFFYIYFMQGIIFSISSTMPYIYPKLPSYPQMSLFFASLFPWSLKFLIAPFLQKYTIMSYGKRKTWLIASKIGAALLLYTVSRFTDYEQIDTFAWLLIMLNFVMVFHNIASESLSIKHFKNKQRIGILQILGDYGGAATGGLLMMKLTSPQFAEKLNFHSSIATPSTVIIIYAILLLSSIPIIHFWFKERHLKSQDVSNAKDLTQIIKYNKIFFDYDSKYFRLAVFLLLYMQGINFYLASYQYKVIDSGFSRDTYNTIQNLSMIIMIFVTLFMDQLACFQGRVRALAVIFCLFIVNMVLMLTIFPLNVYGVSFSVFLNEFLYAWRKYIIFEVVNTLPLHGVAGMYLTTLTSLNQFAQVNTIHSTIIDFVGFTPCLIFGVIFQTGFLFFLPKINSWVEKGQIEIDKDIQQKQQQSIDDGEMQEKI